MNIRRVTKRKREKISAMSTEAIEREITRYIVRGNGFHPNNPVMHGLVMLHGIGFVPVQTLKNALARRYEDRESAVAAAAPRREK